jgi:hypothetical protein
MKRDVNDASAINLLQMLHIELIAQVRLTGTRNAHPIFIKSALLTATKQLELELTPLSPVENERLHDWPFLCCTLDAYAVLVKL